MRARTTTQPWDGTTGANCSVNSPSSSPVMQSCRDRDTPAYMDAYKKWGADLILSGHLHGGLVRCPGIGAVVTPQGFLFPKYSGEMRREGEQTIVVSRGLGSHTINIRLFNMPEVIAIEVCVR